MRDSVGSIVNKLRTANSEVSQHPHPEQKLQYVVNTHESSIHYIHSCANGLQRAATHIVELVALASEKILLYYVARADSHAASFHEKSILTEKPQRMWNGDCVSTQETKRNRTENMETIQCMPILFLSKRLSSPVAIGQVVHPHLQRHHHQLHHHHRAFCKRFEVANTLKQLAHIVMGRHKCTIYHFSSLVNYSSNPLNSTTKLMKAQQLINIFIMLRQYICTNLNYMHMQRKNG